MPMLSAVKSNAMYDRGQPTVACCDVDGVRCHVLPCFGCRVMDLALRGRSNLILQEY